MTCDHFVLTFFLQNAKFTWNQHIQLLHLTNLTNFFASAFFHISNLYSIITMQWNIHLNLIWRNYFQTFCIFQVQKPIPPVGKKISENLLPTDLMVRMIKKRNAKINNPGEMCMQKQKIFLRNFQRSHHIRLQRAHHSRI